MDRKPQLITSRKNQLIKETSALLNSTSERESTMSYLAEGARLVEDAAKSGVAILRLFYTPAAEKKYASYLAPAMKEADEIYVVEDHVAALLSSTKSTQGVFAQCAFGENLLSNRITGKLIVLENIQDPSNMGNMLRTAEALGIESVLLCGECCDVTSPKVLRASMGAVYRMNFAFAKTPADARNILSKEGYRLYGAVPSDKAEKITAVDFGGKVTVAIGNEGNGLTEEFKAICDGLVTIPMTGRAESLNAATAAAIVMWEMTK